MNNFIDKIILDKLRGFKSDLIFNNKLKSSKLILSDGMPRSGSTLIFNILKILLESNTSYQVSSGWIKDFYNLSDCDIYLLKIHGLSGNKYLKSHKSFYSFRDIRVALVSAHKKFGTPLSIEPIYGWIERYNFAKKNVNLMLKYENFM